MLKALLRLISSTSSKQAAAHNSVCPGSNYEIVHVHFMAQLLLCCICVLPHTLCFRVKGLVPKYVHSGVKTTGESSSASATTVASSTAGRAPQVSMHNTSKCIHFGPIINVYVI